MRTPIAQLTAGFVTVFGLSLLVGPSAMARPGIEKPSEVAGLDGAFYAEVFPTFPTTSANLTFIRLGNDNNAASVFHVTAVGAPSGEFYGAGDISVPAHATPQYDIGAFLTKIDALPLANGDTSYSFYLNNDDANTYFQTVIYNGGNGFFEDTTICASGGSLQGSKNVANVHTSKLASNNYPSTIYVHNLLYVDAEYKVTVRDSGTGTVLGTVASVPVKANSTTAFPFSYFESRVTIPANVVHATLEFKPTAAFAAILDPTGTPPNPDPDDIGAIFGNTVFSAPFNAFLNLSNKCRINR
ncbi:MAG: hypothetical protein K1X51_13045 [Rhodospirillaceae bacterium]|nr:hypothetical protein [Rhodospirillaceae bacterium]